MAEMRFNGEMLFMYADRTAIRALFNKKTGVIVQFDTVQPVLPDMTEADLEELRQEIRDKSGRPTDAA